MPDSALAQADTVDTEILLSVLAQVRAGDFTARMPLEPWLPAAAASPR